jgi:hypothetical protein
VSKRVSPCERLHAQIDEVFAGGADLVSLVKRSGSVAILVILGI